MKFDCGCEIFIENDKIDYYKIVRQLNYQPSCPKVWKMLSAGHTKGVFQLETDLGQNWCEKLEPENLEHLAALGAILRPGTLKSYDEDGKSMTQHYVDRKNNREPTKSLADCVELNNILDETYQIIIYQEESIRIAQDLAGFSSSEADILRRAMGKKDAKLMASLKENFVNGCEKVGKLTKEEADKIFENIKASNRYAFNKSHSIAYGSIGYLTAWVKAHFPLKFFKSWIKFYKEKIDEIGELHDLYYDAKFFNISLLPPSIDGESETYIDGKSIRLGLSSIKRIGEAKLSELSKLIAEKTNILGPVNEWNWSEFLFHFGPNISSVVMNGLICSGALDIFLLDRQYMLYEYNQYRNLSKREQKFLNENTYPTLLTGLQNIILKTVKEGGVNKNRKEKIKSIIDLLQNPPQSTKDTIRWIIIQEKDLLNLPLTYTMNDLVSSVHTTHNCMEFKDLEVNDYCIILAQIVDSKEWKIKNGKNKGKPMGGLKLEDNKGKIDAAAFSDFYSDNKELLYKGNILLFEGKKSERKSLIIQKIHNIL